MKRIALALCFCVAPMFVAFCWSSATARDLVKIDTCWIDESPGFNIWYAQKMGWDKEEGLDIVMHLFTSGPAQMEALPAKQWVLGSTGAGGQLTGIIRYDVYSVAGCICGLGILPPRSKGGTRNTRKCMVARKQCAA